MPKAAKPQIRNSKSEIRNKFKIRSANDRNAFPPSFEFSTSNFEIVSDFELRISDFSPHRAEEFIGKKLSVRIPVIRGEKFGLNLGKDFPVAAKKFRGASGVYRFFGTCSR
jgi:hypothetical protein